MLLTVSSAAAASDFAARAAAILHYAADQYAPPGGSNPYHNNGLSDPEKYTGPQMLARFALYGPDDSVGNQWFAGSADPTAPNFGNLFHFRYVAPSLAMLRWPDAPAVAAHFPTLLGLPERTGISKNGTGGFVFYRVDNHNAFTGEGTENHIAMSRTAAYLFALKAAQSPERWPAARWRAAQMRQWLLDYVRRAYAVGIGEWDSSTYAVFSVMGWANVFWATGPDGPAFVNDPEVHAAARAMLDFYAVSHAIRYSNGHLGGGESRANRKYDGFQNGTAYLNWLWFGQGDTLPPNNAKQSIYTVYAALSGYQPPAVAVRLARGELSLPAEYLNTKPEYLMREPALGHEVFYRHPLFSLGSVNLRIGGFAGSNWQVLPWKLLTGPTDSTMVLSGNGGFYGRRSNCREPFTQHVQSANVLLQLNRLPENPEALIDEVLALYPQWATDWLADANQRFPALELSGWSHPTPVSHLDGSIDAARFSYLLFPKGQSFVSGQYAVYAQMGAVFTAVMSIRRPLPEIDGNVLFDNTERNSELFGLILEVGSRAEFADLAAFQSAMEAHLAAGAVDRSAASDGVIRYRALVSDRRIEAQFAGSGIWEELAYDWLYGVSQPGGVTFVQAHAWLQPPWPEGDGHGRQPRYRVDGTTFPQPHAPVLNGPHVRLQDSVLRIWDAAAFYEVDASGPAPLFRSES